MRSAGGEIFGLVVSWQWRYALASRFRRRPYRGWIGEIWDRRLARDERPGQSTTDGGEGWRPAEGQSSPAAGKRWPFAGKRRSNLRITYSGAEIAEEISASVPFINLLRIQPSRCVLGGGAEIAEAELVGEPVPGSVEELVLAGGGGDLADMRPLADRDGDVRVAGEVAEAPAAVQHVVAPT